VVNVFRGAYDDARSQYETAAQYGDKRMFCDPRRDLAVMEFSKDQRKAWESIEAAMVCNTKDVWSNLIRARFQLSIDAVRNVSAAHVDASLADRNADSPDPRIKRVLALTMLRTGDYSGAVTTAKAAFDVEDKEDTPTMAHLVLAIADAKLGRLDEAKAELKKADQSWPEKLKEPGAIIFTAPKGRLWYESADELIALRNEAEQLLKLSGD
jgi:tetratricopeptide (TPR) repeat protein